MMGKRTASGRRDRRADAERADGNRLGVPLAGPEDFSKTLTTLDRDLSIRRRRRRLQRRREQPGLFHQRRNHPLPVVVASDEPVHFRSSSRSFVHFVCWTSPLCYSREREREREKERETKRDGERVEFSGGENDDTHTHTQHEKKEPRGGREKKKKKKREREGERERARERERERDKKKRERLWPFGRLWAGENFKKKKKGKRSFKIRFGNNHRRRRRLPSFCPIGLCVREEEEEDERRENDFTTVFDDNSPPSSPPPRRRTSENAMRGWRRNEAVMRRLGLICPMCAPIIFFGRTQKKRRREKKRQNRRLLVVVEREGRGEQWRGVATKTTT